MVKGERRIPDLGKNVKKPTSRLENFESSKKNHELKRKFTIT